MSKYTFTCEHWDGGKVTVEKEIETLNDVLETFEFFLKGSGFYFKGQIDVVPLDDETGDSLTYGEDDDDILFDFGAAQPVPSFSLDDIGVNIVLDDYTDTPDDKKIVIK